MTITKEWLRKKEACRDGIVWFLNQNETDSMIILKKLIEEKMYWWASWLIVRCMEYKQYVSYAIFAAELVIGKIEFNDDRPRKAIEAAKKCVDNPSHENSKAATTAAINAHRAAVAAYADTTYCYYAVACSAIAADVAYTSAAAAYIYADTAACSAAAYADTAATWEKILNYGISLIEGEK